MAPQPTTTSGTAAPALVLSNHIISKFKPAKIFKGAVDAVQPPTPGSQGSRQPHVLPRSITGITFDDRGDQLVTAGDDETFRLYGCKTGKVMKTLNSKKYGIDLPRFTHKNSAIIYASTKEDDTIRYHSLHDNKYLQYFKGHKDRVISLEVAPLNDEFISGSLDKTARLWDLRTPVCRGLIPTPVPPIVAYDPQGVIFAVGINSYAKILVYDSSNFDAGPFMTCKVEDPTLALISFPPREIYMTSISFSSTGRFILAGCSGSAHYVLDAYQGVVIAKLEGHMGLERKSLTSPPTVDPAPGISREEVSWTPDSKFIIGGSLDGRIYVWDVQHLRPLDPPPPSDDSMNTRPTFPPMRIQPLTVLDGHPGPSRCVKFNPRFAMMATAGTELAFWLPDPTADADEVAKELLKKKGFPSA